MERSVRSADTAALTTADGLPVPRRYWAIAAIILAITVTVLDSTIVNVALPSMAHDFRTSDAASIWVVNAYQTAILIALLPLASLGEIVGYRRVSQYGLAVFTVASLACALAPTLPLLSMARVVQGLGAAGIMSVNSALVRFTYPQRMLGRAIGINALAVAVASAAGPTIASAILAITHWRWLFAINVPIGVATLAIALRALPETERAARPFNYRSVVLQAGTFALLIGGLQSLAQDSVTPIAFMEIIAGCTLGVILTRHEIKRDTVPLIPFDLLRIRLFSLSVATSICSFTAQSAGLVALPFEIQRIGHSAAETGLLMTPWPVGVALAAPLAGRLADRYPAGVLGSAGLLALAVGLGLLLLPKHGNSTDLIWRMALCGVGFGFFQAPNNRTLLASAPRARSGAAGGMLASARLLGQTLGAAAVAIMFRANPGRGPSLALTFAAAIALAAAAISVSRLASPTGSPSVQA